MKKRTKIIIAIAVVVVVVALIAINFLLHKQETEKENTISNEIDIYDKNVINEIKNEINATAESDLYQIEEEYDGRQILQIRPNIQFETALAGILKNEKPLENEIQNLLQNKPSKNGIWISKQSRNEFLNLLKDNGVNDYEIDNEGYLYSKKESHDETSKKIKEAIDSNQLFILDMSGTSYIRDEMSGEIVEYPFERMDPYQVLDAYQEENQIILEVTTNAKEKLSKQEILNEILLNLK